MTSRILFLGGPSGAGKSHFAENYLAPHGWLHIEIDAPPSGSGIDGANLREEWDAFYLRHDAVPLRNELLRRIGSAPAVVVSLPSFIVFSAQHLEAAACQFSVAYLFGPHAFCRREFLAREAQLNRGLGVEHWNQFAPAAYAIVTDPANHDLLIPAFTPDGSRRALEEMYADLENILERAA